MYSNNVPRPVRQVLLLVTFLATVCLIQLPAYAQQDQGRIAGTVKDSAGGLVPGASIVVKNERTGEERTATSSDTGAYIVSALRPSLYTVTASAQNLSVRATNVQLLAGQELNLDLALQATGVEAKVDIVAAADTGIDTGTASMGVNVNPREVEALPLNGRQLSQLYLQAPGSVNSGSGTFGDIRFSGRSATECHSLRRHRRLCDHRRVAREPERRSALTVSSAIQPRECAGVSR